ncbi:MAG: hypothetical protein A2847_01530, partial [Candidatus Sungbacteria bacterium RIFCSPHIGHO2_01_FULL_50_25]
MDWVIRGADKKLFWTVIVLFVGGILILSSASIVLSEKHAGTFYYYSLRQLLTGGVVGLACFFAAMHMPYRMWRKFGVFLMVLSFMLLALLFIPQFGFSHGGARRWLAFGSFTFQPSEILKLSFIVYLASWLDARRSDVGSVAYGLIPFSLMVALVSVFLVMQPDIGTLLIILSTVGFMYLLGGGRWHQVGILAVFGIVIGFFLVQLKPYLLNRIWVFFNPDFDPSGIGYQIAQSLIAIGSGGILGRGFGQSIQKYSYLPEPMGDSIFAVYLEEMGFLGALLLVGVFAFFLWRGLHIARRARDTFGKLLASGITVGIFIQAFINMAAISGLLPLTGV